MHSKQGTNVCFVGDFAAVQNLVTLHLTDLPIACMLPIGKGTSCPFPICLFPIGQASSSMTINLLLLS